MKTALAVLTLITLAACAPESKGVTLVRSVGPGPEKPDSATAVALFKSICVESRGQHAKMLELLAGMPVQRDPRSDIYYHSEYDISYKAVMQDGAEACSFVSGVKADSDRIARRIEGAGAAARLSVSSRGETSQSGARYVVARAISG